MAKTKGLSFDQHQALGRRLKAIRGELLDISLTLSKAYGVSRLFGKKAKKAYRAVDELRSTMERALNQDCPGLHSDIFLSIYYGVQANDKEETTLPVAH